MLQKVISTIKRYNMIEDGDGIVIGLSGGPDSVALLHALHSIAERYNLRLFCAHINHNLRGQESDGDEEYSKKICKTLGIPLYVKSAEITKIAKENKLSLEEAGRLIRYEFFNEILEQNNLQKIAVAHNANDNVETVLMRIIRGTGIDGLAGIKPVRDNIIRPLIEIERYSIEEYCKENNLNPRIDSTNLKSDYTRNKIRIELLPYLKENFNPSIMSSLNTLSMIASEDVTFINDYIDENFKNIKVSQNDEYISLNLEKINKYSHGIVSRLFRKCIQNLLGSLEGIHYSNIEDCISFIKTNNPSGSLDLPKGLSLKRNYNEIIFSKNHHKKIIEKYNYSIDIPGKIYIKEDDSYIQTSIIHNFEDIKTDKYTQVFDYEKIEGTLDIRNRRDGDIFSPKGMTGTKKLKDFFIDEKIPKHDRDNIPLIALGNEILWIIGIRPSEKYKLNDKSKVGILIKYEKI